MEREGFYMRARSRGSVCVCEGGSGAGRSA